MLHASQLLLPLNPSDRLPHGRFDLERCIAPARERNPDIEVLRVFAQTGEGLRGGSAWMRAGLAAGAGVAA